MVKQATDEKYLSRNKFDKYLSSRIYKDLSKLNNKKVIQAKCFGG